MPAGASKYVQSCKECSVLRGFVFSKLHMTVVALGLGNCGGRKVVHGVASVVLSRMIFNCWSMLRCRRNPAHKVGAKVPTVADVMKVFLTIFSLGLSMVMH